MSRYRKKPVVVEAFQLMRKPWPDWFYQAGVDGVVTIEFEKSRPRYATIRTLEGNHRAEPDDYIIRGVKGELYPCKPDIFEQTYERVESSDGSSTKDGDQP